MYKSLRNVAVAAAILVAAGCSHKGAETSVNPDAPTTLVVDNQGFPDMTIYIYEGSRRIRLGIVTGHSEQRFTLPKYLVRTITSLRFEADPIGGNRSSFSNEITVNPGEEVTLRIPPG
jgi:hypothetical protein